MPDDVPERLQRITTLLKQLDKVSKQARDLHRMADELSHEAASSIRAAKSIKPKLGAASKNARRKASKKRSRR